METPTDRGQYDGQGVYFGLSTASEVYLIFTTQIYSLFMHLKCLLERNRQEGGIAP